MSTITMMPVSPDLDICNQSSSHFPRNLADVLSSSPQLDLLKSTVTNAATLPLESLSPIVRDDSPSDWFDNDNPSSTPQSTDADTMDTAEQLVNDHNHVGAGHDAHARPHICNYPDCDKAFARKSDLARHFRIHTNDRPFVCTYRGCGKAFIQRSALTVHYRVHTGERPHHCETCDKAFADSSSLARHRRIHTGMRPYTCRVPGCGKPFARRNTLLKHWKRQHPHLPPPSTNSHKMNIHAPVPTSRTPSGSFPSSASTGPNGEHYPATPSTDSAPHGYATLHPPEGTAYTFSGGFPGSVLGGTPGQPAFTFPGPPNTYRTSGFNQSPQAPGSISLTPISSSTSHFGDSVHQGTINQASSTPTTGGFESDGRHFQNGAASAHSGLSPSPGINQQGFSQYPNYFNGYPQPSSYPLSRFPSEGGGMIYSDNKAGITTTQRSVSNPLEAPRFQPYMNTAPFGHVGGGFHPSQLAIPPNHQSHLIPSYYHSMNMAIQPRFEGEVKHELPQSPGDSSDEDDEPLVALHEAPPTFALHPPNGPIMNMPFSAVESGQFGQYPGGQAQILTLPQSNGNGRLHSAPPTLQRFNSLPPVPTTNQWGQVSGFQSHSAGDAKSAHEQWEDIADEMLSREASVADDTQITPPSVEHKTPSGVVEGNQWGEPIEYPVPPLDNRKNPFSSAASSSSTASTLVGSSIQSMQPPNHLPPIYTHTANQPMALTPINPNGFYPSPITPANWSQDGLKHVYETPIIYGQQHQDRDQENDTSHDITLTTPPKWLEQQRKDGRTVSAVGLGIANVHFDERDSNIVTEKEDQEWAEGEEERVSDAETIDGSDDEFVLGKKPKRARNSTGRGRGRGGARGIGARRGRKSN